MPNCHRPKLPNRRTNNPKAKVWQERWLGQGAPSRSCKSSRFWWTNAVIQRQRMRSLSSCAPCVPGGGRSEARRPLGRWRDLAWRLWLPGILVGDGAPRPSAFTVASARYLHGSRRERHGGSQVSVRKAGVGRVVSNIPGFVRFRTVNFWRPIQNCSFSILSTPDLGVFDSFGKGYVESSAVVRGCPGQLRPLLTFTPFSLRILLSACFFCN